MSDFLQTTLAAEAHLAEEFFFFSLIFLGGILRLSPLGTSAIIWPIVSTPDDR
jgi:hypothetical protein